jgi:hypothetical protein
MGRQARNAHGREQVARETQEVPSMSIETIKPTIKLPREGRNLAQAMSFARANFPATVSITLEKFEIILHFSKPQVEAVTKDRALELADNILARHNEALHASQDRRAAHSLLNPADIYATHLEERRSTFTRGTVYLGHGARPALVLAYEEGPRSWKVTTVTVCEVRPGVWKRTANPTTHCTNPGHTVRILARNVAA